MTLFHTSLGFVLLLLKVNTRKVGIEILENYMYFNHICSWVTWGVLNWLNNSTGNGKIMVEFFSAEI